MLKQIYELYRSKSPINLKADLFYPPLLMSIPQESWKTSTHRILWIGQETREWCHGHVRSLVDFFAASETGENPIDILMQKYEIFDFGHEYPQLLRAPFFSFFHQTLNKIQSSGSQTSIAWTNIIKCSAGNVDGEFVISSLPQQQREAFLDWQQGILLSEIEILKPTLVIFLTGPNYDYSIDREFPGVQRHVTSGYTGSQFAKLSHSGLPQHSYRTYHPGYLNRSIGFSPIDTMINSYLT